MEWEWEVDHKQVCCFFWERTWQHFTQPSLSSPHLLISTNFPHSPHQSAKGRTFFKTDTLVFKWVLSSCFLVVSLQQFCSMGENKNTPEQEAGESLYKSIRKGGRQPQDISRWGNLQEIRWGLSEKSIYSALPLQPQMKLFVLKHCKEWQKLHAADQILSLDHFNPHMWKRQRERERKTEEGRERERAPIKWRCDGIWWKKDGKCLLPTFWWLSPAWCVLAPQ